MKLLSHKTEENLLLVTAQMVVESIMLSEIK